MNRRPSDAGRPRGGRAAVTPAPTPPKRTVESKPAPLAEVIPKHQAAQLPGPLNSRLRVPSIFPVTYDCPEESLHCLNVLNGYTEVSPVRDEHATMLEFMTADWFSIPKFKEELTKELNSLSWRKAAQVQQSIATPKEKPVRSEHQFPMLNPLVLNKEHVDQWLQELAGDSPLRELASRIPGHARGLVLMRWLAHYQVPLLRATWMIKVYYLNSTISSGAPRGRKTSASNSSASEIPMNFAIFLKNLISLISGKATTDIQKTVAEIRETRETLLCKYHYFVKLINWCIDEGLLDQQLLFNTLLTKVGLDFGDAQEMCLLLHFLFPHLWQIVKQQENIRTILVLCQGRLLKFGNENAPWSGLVHSMASDIVRVVLCSHAELLVGFDREQLKSCVHSKIIAQPRLIDVDPLFALLEKDAVCLQALGTFKPKDSSASVGDSIVELVELFDKFSLTNEVDDWLNELKSKELFWTKEGILLLCSWAVSPTRRNLKHNAYVCVSLFKRVKTDGLLTIDLRATLIEFLHKSHWDDENMPLLLMLFREFVRNKIFSQEKYMRYLVSRGILDQTNEVAMLARRILTDLAVMSQSSDDHNQRRIILFGLRSKRDLDSRLLDYCKQAITSFFESISSGSKTAINWTPPPISTELTEHFHVATGRPTYLLRQLWSYHQVPMIDWMMTSVKEWLKGSNSIVNRLLLHMSLLLFESIRDFDSIGRLLYWTLKHTNNFEWLVAGWLRRQSRAIGSIGLLPKFLSLFHKRGDEEVTVTLKSLYSDQLVEIVKLNQASISVARWVETTLPATALRKRLDNALQETKTITGDPMIGRPATTTLHKTKIVDLTSIADSRWYERIESLADRYADMAGELDGLSNLIRAVINHVSKKWLSTDCNSQMLVIGHASFLVELQRRTANVNHDQLLMKLLKEEFIQRLVFSGGVALASNSNAVALLSLVVRLLTINYLRLDHLLVKVISSLVHSCTKVQDIKCVFEIVETLLVNLRVTLADAPDEEEISMEVLRELVDQVVVMSVVEQMTRVASKVDGWSLIDRILGAIGRRGLGGVTSDKLLTFARALDASPSVVRLKLYILLGDDRNFMALNKQPSTGTSSTSAEATTSKNTVKVQGITEAARVMRSVDVWNVQMSFVKLRLLIDEWTAGIEQLTSADASRMASGERGGEDKPINWVCGVVLYQLAARPELCAQYAQLIAALDYDAIAASLARLLRVIDRIETRTGAKSLFVALREEFLAALHEDKKTAISQDNEQHELHVQEAVIGLVTSLLQVQTSIELRTKFIEQLMKHFMEYSCHFQEIDLKQPTKVALRTMQLNILFRLRLFLPLSRSVNRDRYPGKYEDMVWTFIRLLANPTIQINEFGVSLTGTLLEVIDSICEPMRERKEKPQQQLRADTDFRDRLATDIRQMDLPVELRKQIERILPFTRQPKPSKLILAGVPQTTARTSPIPTPTPTPYPPELPSPQTPGSVVTQKEPVTRHYDRWSLLEDFADGPLSPSAFGGGRIERTTLKYATNLLKSRKRSAEMYEEPPAKRHRHSDY